ncbi:MAG: hypothetical protein DRJ05_19860 [Bacteroidetes bacterium]|nr:MAG: hypothetical protein DRJ05_19860 [Bacteroidota bacterium]
MRLRQRYKNILINNSKRIKSLNSQITSQIKSVMLSDTPTVFNYWAKVPYKRFCNTLNKIPIFAFFKLKYFSG